MTKSTEKIKLEKINNIDKFDSNQLEALKEEVIQSDNGLDKLVKIYESGGADIVSKLLENILLDKTLTLENKINFLNKFKGKERKLYYYSIIQVLLSLDNEAQLNEFINAIPKEDLKTALLYYPKLDKDFENEFLNTYASNDKDFYCGGKKSKDCDLVGSYIYTLMKKYNQKINPEVAYGAIVRSFDKNAIKNFATELREILNLKSRLTEVYGDKLKKVFEKNGLVGVLKYFNDTILDNLGFNETGKSVIYLGEAIAGIFGLFKLVSYVFNKLGWKGILGGGLLGLLYVGNDKVHDMAQPVVDFFDKFFTGGFGDGNKKEAVRLGKENKENAILIAGPLFVSTLFSGKKVEDIKKYLKIDNGKINFDIKKYLEDLPNDSWMKVLILQMGEKKAKILIEDGLSKLGINDKTNSNLQLDDLLKQYKNKIQNETKEKVVTSNSVNTVTVAGAASSVNGINQAVTKNHQSNINTTNKAFKKVSNRFQSDNKLSSVKVSNESKPNKVQSNIDSYSLVEELMYRKNGNYYILGKDGKGRLVTTETLNLIPEIKEKLKKYQLFKEKVDLVVFMIQALGQKYPDTCGKHVQKALVNIQKELITILNLTNPDFDKIFRDKILFQIKEVADAKNPYARYGRLYDEIREIFTKKYNSIEDLKIAVYNYIRELGLSDMIANRIAEENFYQLKISEKQLDEYYKCLCENNISCITNDKAIKNFLNSVRKKPENFAEDLRNLLKNLYKAKEDLNISELAKNANMTPNEYEEALNKLMLKKGLKLLLFSYWIDSKVDNWGNIRDEYKNSVENYRALNLFSGIKGYGILNLSDANSEIFHQLVMLAAIEIVSLGVGGLIAGAGATALDSFTAVRLAARGAEIVKDISTLSRLEKMLNILEIGGQIYRVSKAGKIAYVVAGTILEGTLFYEGANLVQNVFEKRNLFDGAGNVKEIVKSILFVGAMKGFGKLAEKIPALKVKGDEKLVSKVIKLGSQVTLEGLGIGFISGGINVVFGEGRWEPEDFMEGIIMALMFRLAGGTAKKLLIRKGEDGEIKLFKINSKENEKDYKHERSEALHTLKNKSVNTSKLDISEPVKLSISNNKEIEIGYDKNKKKYYIKEDGSILEFTNYKSIKKYVEEKGWSDMLKEKIRAKKISDYIQSTEYKKKNSDTNIYIREINGKDFEIKTSDGKTYVIGKEKINGKEEFYVIPKEGDKYKIKEKKFVDKFLKEHAEIIKNYDEKIEKAFQQKLSNSNQKLTKQDANKIAKILGIQAKLLYNKTIGQVFNDISALLKKEGVYIKNKDVLNALNLPIKWILTGKIEKITFGEGVKQVGKNVLWLSIPYIIQGFAGNGLSLNSINLSVGSFLTDLKENPVNVLIEYILRANYKLVASGYDGLKIFLDVFKEKSPTNIQNF